MSFGKHAAETEKTPSAQALSELIPLFREIGNLKRIRAANTGGKPFAADLFKRAWGSINGGADVRSVAVAVAKDAVIGANLGAIDAAVLKSARLNESEIAEITRRAFESSATSLNADLRDEMREKSSAIQSASDKIRVPRFAELLSVQPRSGATKTGAPKLIFDAPENHAAHSIIVGVYAVLLAPLYHADIETVFLAALAHHFHNAYLPDSGFAGEELLGEFLPRIFDVFRRECLTEIPENLHGKIWHALEIIETADAPEAQAFHAADVIDRVLQMRHHAEANEFTLKYALEEAELVHAGAIQTFHYEVLRAANLI